MSANSGRFRHAGPVVALVVMLLLWLPLVTVIVYSFNAARLGAGWKGFTWAWYGALWENDAVLSAARKTLWLAGASAAVSTALGTLMGYGLGRQKGRWARLADRALQVPIFVPDVVLAVGLLLWFAWLRRWLGWLEPGLATMWLGHVAFQIPFVAVVVRARAAGLDPALEEAARDLGATPWRTFRHVTLPLLWPGVLGGALLAFTLSLDDFSVSFFTSGPGSTTLPVLIYASARRGITPDVNALSAILIVTTLVAVLLSRWVRERRPMASGSSLAGSG